MTHIAIGIEDEDEDEKAPICVVCTDPMGWVAVFPCGHREVCVLCAASIRFVHNDLRCCICRSHCSTVVVTKANRSACGQRGFPFLWPPPPAFASQVTVGHYFWYHHGMRAYFDDVCQYQEMKKVCTTTSPGSKAADGAPVLNYLDRYRDALFPQPAAYVNVNLNEVSVSPRQAAAAPPSPSSSEDMGTILVWIAVLMSLLTTGVFLMVAEHPYPKVLIVVLVCALFPPFTACTIYVWRKFSNNSFQYNGDG